MSSSYEVCDKHVFKHYHGSPYKSILRQAFETKNAKHVLIVTQTTRNSNLGDIIKPDGHIQFLCGFYVPKFSVSVDNVMDHLMLLLPQK